MDNGLWQRRDGGIINDRKFGVRRDNDRTGLRDEVPDSGSASVVERGASSAPGSCKLQCLLVTSSAGIMRPIMPADDAELIDPNYRTIDVPNWLLTEFKL